MKEHKKRSRQGCPLIEDLVMDEVVVVVVVVVGTRKRIRLLKKSSNEHQQVSTSDEGKGGKLSSSCDQL